MNVFQPRPSLSLQDPLKCYIPIYFLVFLVVSFFLTFPQMYHICFYSSSFVLHTLPIASSLNTTSKSHLSQCYKIHILKLIVTHLFYFSYGTRVLLPLHGKSAIGTYCEQAELSCEFKSRGHEFFSPFT
jgi:hypothetical protein